jgi:hypothetical protein
MTIKYSDGIAVEAVLLSRTENMMRLAVPGAEDVVEVTDINGTWVTSDCEPVSIEFAWQRLDRKPTVTEAECCCSRELAAKLLQALFVGDSEEEERKELEMSRNSHQVAVRCC